VTLPLTPVSKPGARGRSLDSRTRSLAPLRGAKDDVAPTHGICADRKRIPFGGVREMTKWRKRNTPTATGAE